MATNLTASLQPLIEQVVFAGVVILILTVAAAMTAVYVLKTGTFKFLKILKNQTETTKKEAIFQKRLEKEERNEEYQEWKRNKRQENRQISNIENKENRLTARENRDEYRQNRPSNNVRNKTFQHRKFNNTKSRF